MNYLAHAWLSFKYPGILTGNLISDFVKGKKQFNYSRDIHLGIRLHRAIDEFTDSHPSTKQINQHFRPHYRLYAGAFTDIVYDYFLANDKSEFQQHEDLKEFSRYVYTELEKRSIELPLTFLAIFPNMKSYDWLYNYRYEWAIEKSFQGLSYRSKYLGETNTAYSIFLQYKEVIRLQYAHFFPQLKEFSMGTLEKLLNEV